MSAVIFDFNGTLFYDTDKHVLAWRRFFLEETGSIPDDDAFKNIVIGSDNTTIFQKLFC
jgi:beta-phosphoglucomutase-like phosphatase (HAD superfamily)